MTKIDHKRMAELRSKEYLTADEFKELGHMRLAELILEHSIAPLINRHIV